MARENRRKREERRFGRPERLADRVEHGHWFLMDWCSPLLERPESRDSLGRTKADLLDRIGLAKVIVADNVSEYFYAMNPKEEWDYGEDYPSLAPPFPLMFIEFSRPSRLNSDGRILSPSRFPERWGWVVEADTRAEFLARLGQPGTREEQLAYLRDQLDQITPLVDMEIVRQACRSGSLVEAVAVLKGREKTFLVLLASYRAQESGEWVVPDDAAWFVKASVVAAFGDRVSTFGSSTFAVAGNGRMIAHPMFQIMGGNLVAARQADEIRDTLNCLLMPVAMTLSFLHCKNVMLEAHEPDPIVNRERRRNGRKPFLRYHTINIEPMKAVLRTEGNIESEGLKRALHICRGHFATYTADKPLFGRTVGTVWRPSHVRGHASEGVVVSDYNVDPTKN